MYIIENVTDREGNIKVDFINELKQLHPKLESNIIYKEFLSIGNFLCFLWNDDSEKMLRTSAIIDINYDDNIMIIETKNSVYYLRKI